MISKTNLGMPYESKNLSTKIPEVICHLWKME